MVSVAQISETKVEKIMILNQSSISYGTTTVTHIMYGNTTFVETFVNSFHSRRYGEFQDETFHFKYLFRQWFEVFQYVIITLWIFIWVIIRQVLRWHHFPVNSDIGIDKMSFNLTLFHFHIYIGNYMTSFMITLFFKIVTIQYNANGMHCSAHNIKTSISRWRLDMSNTWLVIVQFKTDEFSVVTWIVQHNVERWINSERLFQTSGPLIERAPFPNFRHDWTQMKSPFETDRTLCLDKMEE